jgi:hypothetical protein
MNILSESERTALLQSLTDAPDEVLIDAVRQRKDWMRNIKSSFDEVRNFVGMRVTEASKPPLSATTPLVTPSIEKQPTAPEKRTNKSPGASSIGKIGGKTKDEIIGVLKAGRQPNHDKYGEHLKLLWNRGEICFDGKEFYLGK